MHGTLKPQANQVRGSRSKESFRDFLGSSIIIHHMPDDGKECVEGVLRVVSTCLIGLSGNLERRSEVGERRRRLKEGELLEENSNHNLMWLPSKPLILIELARLHPAKVHSEQSFLRQFSIDLSLVLSICARGDLKYPCMHLTLNDNSLPLACN